MRWTHYLFALLVTIVAGFLWYVVLVIYPAADTMHAAMSMSRPRTLPVVPVLHTMSPAVTPAIHERFLCVAGYVARQKGEQVETLLVENKPVRCR